MASTWRNFKNIFSRPLFTIIFRSKMLKFHPYSILTRETMVEFVIYCLLIFVDYFCFCSSFNICKNLGSHGNLGPPSLLTGAPAHICSCRYIAALLLRRPIQCDLCDAQWTERDQKTHNLKQNSLLVADISYTIHLVPAFYFGGCHLCKV